MKIFICTNKNQLIGAKVAKNSIIRKSHFEDHDVEILDESDCHDIKSMYSKSYLREGKEMVFDENDMQSFTLMRFLIPEKMNFKGKALVVDPDIFLVRPFLEDLQKINLDNVSICCRKGLQKKSWGSSVMLLNCEKLKHWSLKNFIKALQAREYDYSDLINLRLEDGNIMELEPKWNDFDNLDENTVLLHLTEKLTQPWRAGLKLNSFIPPIFKFFPRAPLYRLIGRNLRLGIEHPDSHITDLFFNELSICIKENIINKEDIYQGIRDNYIRKDIFIKLEQY